jgi:hypothetical protein
VIGTPGAGDAGGAPRAGADGDETTAAKSKLSDIRRPPGEEVRRRKKEKGKGKREKVVGWALAHAALVPA